MILNQIQSQRLHNLMIPIDAEEVVIAVIAGHGGGGAGMSRIVHLMRVVVIVIGVGGRRSPPGPLLKRK